MPLRFGGMDLLSLDQEDTPNPGGSAVCMCPSQLRVGFKVSFWLCIPVQFRESRW